MELRKLIHQIQHCIEYNDINQALNLIDQFYRKIGKDSSHELVMLKSNWRDWQRNNISGILDEEEKMKLKSELKERILSYTDYIFQRERFHIHDESLFDDEKKVLDRQSEEVVKLFILYLEKDEQNSVVYIKRSTILSWMNFKREQVKYLEKILANDLFEFINTIIRLTIKNLRQELIDELKKQYVLTTEENPLDRIRRNDKIIFETLVESESENISANEFAEAFIEKTFLKLNFNLKAKIYNHLKSFLEKFSLGELSNQTSLHRRPNENAYFFTEANELFGTIDSLQIDQIAGAINPKERIKISLIPQIERMVSVINNQRSIDLHEIEKKILKNKMQEIEYLKNNMGLGRLPFLIYSTIISILLIGGYHFLFSPSGEVIRQQQEYLENRLDTLDQEVKHFDQQNQQILEGIEKIQNGE